MKMKRAAQLVVAGVGLVATLAVAPRRADACGGFFCSQVPIDQSGEQIIFSVTQSHVTAHIQISYQGQAKDFAWVVPVQTQPKLSVGSQAVFTALQQQTQPQFQVDWKLDTNRCGIYPPNAGPTAGGGAPGRGTQDDGVMVLDMKAVGPYDSVTLSATDPKALVEWLNKNGYQQPPAAEALIKHYVDAGMFFVGLKLQQNASAGDIQPIVLDMDNPEPCVPLILTRVAAVPDMPVHTYVLAKTRAFPRNWFHVTINERKIDWISNGSNYAKVATEAINEAAGHGFITEFAGKSDFLKNAVYQEGRWNLDQLAMTSDPVAFVNLLLNMGFPRDQTMQALLRMFIPMPQALKDMGVAESAFYNNLAMYREHLAPFDPAMFTAALNERVIMPLKAAQQMIDQQPYLTRLYSTVSPEEMNRDPLFHLNPDLPPVSNIHKATATGECNTDGTIRNVKLTIPGGGAPISIPGPIQFYGNPQPWNYAVAEPYAARIELVSAFGEPAVYTKGQALVADKYLDQEDPDAVRGRNIPIEGQPSQAGSDCSFGRDSRSGAGAVALIALALFLGRRRRR
jgi:MYXO-CTERM domain-containing protein